MEEKGTKELKELLDGLFTFYIFAKEAAADGLDWQDGAAFVSKFLQDDEFKEDLVKAFSGLKDMEKEVKDLDFAEGLELVQYVLDKLK